MLVSQRKTAPCRTIHVRRIPFVCGAVSVHTETVSISSDLDGRISTVSGGFPKGDDDTSLCIATRASAPGPVYLSIRAIVPAIYNNVLRPLVRTMDIDRGGSCARSWHCFLLRSAVCSWTEQGQSPIRAVVNPIYSGFRTSGARRLTTYPWKCTSHWRSETWRKDGSFDHNQRSPRVRKRVFNLHVHVVLAALVLALDVQCYELLASQPTVCTKCCEGTVVFFALSSALACYYEVRRLHQGG